MTEYQTHAALVAQLDRTASELQDTCHKQAQRIAVLEQAARQALEVLSELAEWESEGDPRHPATTAITALREALEEAPEPAAVDQKPVLTVRFDAQGWRNVVDALTALPDGAPLYTAPHPPAVGLEPVALGPLAKRRVFDYIRGAYDLGYNDARNARAVPGDNAPGYKGRDVEVDHGGALFNALRACITAPQPARQPLTEGELDLILQKSPIKANYADLTALVRAVEKAHGIGGEA